MFIKLRNFTSTLKEVKKSIKNIENLSPCLENVLAEYLMIKLFADFEDDMGIILKNFRAKSAGLNEFLTHWLQELSNTRKNIYNKNLASHLESKCIITSAEQRTITNLIYFRNDMSCHVATIARVYTIKDVEAEAKNVKSFLQKVARINLLKI